MVLIQPDKLYKEHCKVEKYFLTLCKSLNPMKKDNLIRRDKR